MTGVLIRKGNLDPETNMQREDGVKTQAEDSHRQVTEGGGEGLLPHSPGEDPTPSALWFWTP